MGKTNKNEIHEHLFESNVPVWKQLIKVATPMLLLSLSNASYAFIDTLLAILLITDPSYSAAQILGLTYPLLLLATSFIAIIFSGLSLYLPRTLGREKYEKGRNLVIHTFVYGFFLSLAIIIILYFLAPLWMNWLGGLGSPLTQQEIDGGIIYIRISSLMIIFIAMRDIILRTIRVENKGFMASIIPIVALPVNLLFDWIFMGPLGFKLGGAALASLIGVSCGFLFAFIYSLILIKKNETIVNYEFSRFNIKEGKYIKGLFMFGFNSYIRMVTLIIYNIFLTFFIIQLNGNNGSDDDYWKEFVTVTQRFVSMATIFAFAFVQASITLFAFNKGQKNYARAKEFLKLGAIYSFVSSIIVIIILAIFVNPVLVLFGVDDPSGNQIYANAFYIRLIAIPLSLLQYYFISFFSITKNLKETIINSIIGNIIVAISVLSIFFYVGYQNNGNSTIFFSSLIVIGVINAIIFTPRFIIKYKKEFNYPKEKVKQ
ncbi:MAG: hypothetical protein HPAVJP_2120 [Candidatus Hepatoplasma vulgare]|nr:MAG: hypothetical protein HPAVJP_2120 [Candidatus Hepatoplasma sp.]